MKEIFNAAARYFRRLDKTLFLLTALLGAFGVVMLYSIVTNDISTIRVGSRLYITQFVALCSGLAAALILSAVDYHKIVKLWYIYAPISVLLVLLTFTSLGITVESTGDRAWLDLGFITVQPSELLKISFICTFSIHLSKVEDDINKIGNVLLLVLHAAAPTALILVQGDDGTALVFALISAFMLFAAGISWLYIIPCLIAAPVGGYVLWNYFMKPHQKMRFLVLFDETLDPMGYGYQQYYGKMALGSGRIFGKGLFGDDFIQVPEAQNDFIFAYIGQALGFIGCAAVIFVMTFVFMRIFADSRISKDALGRNICIGMFSLIFIHCLLNIGMVIGVMPVIGVPLPFISQGGSALISLFSGIGLVMSTYSHSEKKYKMFYDAE